MFEFIDSNTLLAECNSFKKEGELLVVGVVTPVQTLFLKSNVISFFNKEIMDYNIHHRDLIIYLIAAIYGIKEITAVKEFERLKNFDQSLEILVPNLEKNFILMRFVLEKNKTTCLVDIPSFITTRQIEELASINDQLKGIDAIIEASISGYNPYTQKTEEDMQIFFDEEESVNQIDQAIEYLKGENRVVDYDLPLPRETIIESVRSKDSQLKSKLT